MDNSVLNVFHVPTEKNGGDLLTEPLSSTVWKEITEKLGLVRYNEEEC